MNGSFKGWLFKEAFGLTKGVYVKKKKYLFLMTFLFLLFASCKKSEKQKIENSISENQNQEQAESESNFNLEDFENSFKEKIQYGYADGVNLFDDASLWKESLDGEMLFAGITLPLGEHLDLLTNEDGTYIKKTAIRNSNGKKEEREFVYILYEEKNYWIQTNLIALGKIPALVTQESFLYKDAKNAYACSPTVILSFGDIIAVSQNEIVGHQGNVFYEASLRKENNFYENVYVENIFTTEKEAFSLMQICKNLDTFTDKLFVDEAILIGSKIASSGKVESSLVDYFTQKSIDALSKIESPSAVEDCFLFDDYYVDSLSGEKESYEIFSEANDKSYVLNTISSGQKYEIIMMKKNMEEVDGREGHWYYIRSLSDDGDFETCGWVFGDDFNVFARYIEKYGGE